MVFEYIISVMYVLLSYILNSRLYFHVIILFLSLFSFNLISLVSLASFFLKALQDTQRRAIENYQADPLKLYVAESFVGKGTYLKRIRYHGRGMHGLMHKYYAHYFLKLKEGTPPVRPRWSKEQSRRYKTRRLIQRGPLNVPNSL